MLLEDKFIDKSLAILRISDEIPGSAHEPFFAVLPTKIKSCKYLSTRTIKSHVAESEMKSQKETGLF